MGYLAGPALKFVAEMPLAMVSQNLNKCWVEEFLYVVVRASGLDPRSAEILVDDVLARVVAEQRPRRRRQRRLLADPRAVLYPAAASPTEIAPAATTTALGSVMGAAAMNAETPAMIDKIAVHDILCSLV